MTRFLQEISGKLDKEVVERKRLRGETVSNPHYWEESAKRELENKMNEASEKAVVDENGVIRWKSNNRCLMDDYCEILEYGGFDFSREATAKARSVEDAKFIKEYRESMKNHVYSDEEMAEMRNAFGEGTKVVNVISGKEIML